MKLSAVVLTKNEEKNIGDCLKTLNFAHEIIIVDDYSEDKTLEIAKKSGDTVKIFEHRLDGDFSKQRNFGLSKTSGDWVLFLDADERVFEKLALEISNIQYKTADKYKGFYIKRIDQIWGKELKYGETANIKLLRLAKKNAGSWEGKVHEEWKVNGEAGQLENPISHYPHKNISDFLKEINFYTDLRSKELYDNGIRVNWVSIIIYPLAKFLCNYFIRKGFLDGTEGFLSAAFMSLHSFLVRGKLWMLWQKR
ncbi:MAG: glycosyltransferase family 2 protein [Candidatus Levybacteria bacterium]|nr:glycosyltransferase family 2 protein [Candidatus Levybacteria bacterium]